MPTVFSKSKKADNSAFRVYAREQRFNTVAIYTVRASSAWV